MKDKDGFEWRDGDFLTGAELTGFFYYVARLTRSGDIANLTRKLPTLVERMDRAIDARKGQRKNGRGGGVVTNPVNFDLGKSTGEED